MPPKTNAGKINRQTDFQEILFLPSFFIQHETPGCGHNKFQQEKTSEKLHH